MIQELICEERETKTREWAAASDGGWRAVPSPADPQMLRIEHTRVTVELPAPTAAFLNAYRRWAAYDYWAPTIQGAGNWLLIREGDTDATFALDDKPGMRPLAHDDVTSTWEGDRRFVWRAPAPEWKQAYVGAIVEVEPASSGSARVTETLYVDVYANHLPLVAGALRLRDRDRATVSAFLEQRLRRVAWFLLLGEVPPHGAPAIHDEPDENCFRRDERVSQPRSGGVERQTVPAGAPQAWADAPLSLRRVGRNGNRGHPERIRSHRCNTVCAQRTR